MTSDAPAGSTVPRPGPAGSLRARYGRTAIIVAAVVAVAVVIVAVAVAAGAAGAAAGPSRAVSETAGSIRTVDFQGVPGQLTVTATPGDQVQLTGHLTWKSHHRAGTASARTSNGVLHLVSRCATGSPCSENFRLAVPAHTAVVLTQPSGHIVVSGLDAALQITAASSSISATGLRSPSLSATLRSAHLGASFAAAPQQVSLTMTSAQATLRLPAAGPYLVSSQVRWGYIKVGVPQSASSSRHITARLTSSELELLP
jgi:hypothetical protein